MIVRILGVFSMALALGLVGGVRVAHGQLTQPDGTEIPTGSGLANVFEDEEEPIDPSTDALTVPETFRPDCALTFTVIRRDASMNNSFGWYNVTDVAPEPDELYQFIDCDDDVGVSRVLDIQDDPRYLGGEIAFFQATPQGVSGNCPDVADPSSYGYIYYSETDHNPDHPEGNYIHLLILDSVIYENTFYFAWEDLFQGGDNDFTDLVMRVEGIQCSGAGEPCDTGELGVCADGLTQCTDGEIECIRLQDPRDEVCNGFDDNCDGQIDEGDDLCPDFQVCDRGRCVDVCGGEFLVCPPTFVCNDDGRCVPSGCEEVDCPAGERCVHGGDCVAACEGIVCPHGQTCRAGRCVDPCDGVSCDDGQVCDEGVCVLCACRGCLNDRVCNDAQNACVVPGCESMTCPEGTHCEPGGDECIDDCEGAVCPEGYACEAGNCEPIPAEAPEEADHGADAGAGAGIGAPGAPGSPGSPGEGSLDGGVGDGNVGFDLEGRERDTGCDCSIESSGGRASAASTLVSLLLAMVLLQRRRRRG